MFDLEREGVLKQIESPREVFDREKYGRRDLFVGSIAIAAAGFALTKSSQSEAQARSVTTLNYIYGSQVVQAATYGVTGINDGGRDDAPLLRNAYAAVVAAGAKCLILPVGAVYLNSFTSDTEYPGYPYNYALRIQEDDFVVVVPEGCTVYCNTPGAIGDTNCVAAIQVTGKQGGLSLVSRSGVTGGGKFLHTYPGMTSSTPNNNWSAVYVTASTNDCFIDNLEAQGFGATYVHAFDSSSSFRGRMSRLRAFNCYKAIAQSSLQSTASHEMFDLKIVDYYCFGLTLSGPNNVLNFLSVDNGGASPINNSIALNAIGRLENFIASNIKLVGSKKSSDQGIYMSPSIFNLTGKISLANVVVKNFVSALVPQGLNNAPVISNFELSSGVYACWINSVSGSGANNCGDIYLKDGVIEGFSYGLLAGASQFDSSQGNYYLENIKITNTKTPFWNTIPFIGDVKNVLPLPTISQRHNYQRVPSGGLIAVESGINGLKTILTGTANTTLVLPESPVDGQEWELRSEGDIALFSFIGGVVVGAPDSLYKGYGRRFVYSENILSWI